MHSVYDFVISASHSKCSVVTLQNQFDIIVSEDKLNELFETAYLHGVFPLIYLKLKLLNIDNDILETFKKENRYIAQVNMRRTSELLEVVELFKKNNIDYMAIKGPVLSQLIHGDISQRQYSDLDILIKPESVFNAGKLLTEHNYKTDEDINFLKNKILLTIGKDFYFRNIQSNNILELHWRLFSNVDMHVSEINLFSDNFQSVEVSQKTVKTLSTENLLIYLSLHGSKHYWERLAWVVDIDRLISQNSIDWDSVEKIISDMKNEKMFYLGLLVSVRLFNTSLPYSILCKTQSYETLIPVVDDIIHQLYSNNIAIEENIEKAWIDKIIAMGKVKDTKLHIIHHYFVTLFQLRAGDIYVINLPYFLSPLYYVIRIFRIFFKLQK